MMPTQETAAKHMLNTAPDKTARLLLLSQNAGLREEWKRRLADTHWQITEARSGVEALERLLEQGSELMLLDPNLPDLEAAEFEALVRNEHPGLQIITLAAASGFLAPVTVSTQTLPCGPSLQRAVTLHTEGLSSAARATLPQRTTWRDGWHELVGASPAMQKVYRAGQLVARRDTTVLIQGASGTGKDLLARAIHLSSSREKQPFVVINCAAIPEALLEAELFGYTKGAFTGAAQSRIGRVHAAHGGTLFLDEIGDMPYPLQSKILRFLEQGEVQRIGGADTIKVDCRVLAATNADLKAHVSAGRFREDLYYRLAIFPVHLPALRDRLEDLDGLVNHFAARFSPGCTVSAAARQALREHDWPGNVRELRNVMERASLFAEDAREIDAEHIVL